MNKTTLIISLTNLVKQTFGTNSSRNSLVVSVLEFVPKEIVGISNDSKENKAEVIFSGDLESTQFYHLRKDKKRCSKSKGVERKVILIR